MAGISFCAATGERFLIHLDMGRLHFTSIRSHDAWARVWAIFHLLGLGPEVAPECVGFAGFLAGDRIPWTPDDNQRAVMRPTRGSELYDGMRGLHGPRGEALQAVTWGPNDDPYTAVDTTWVRGLEDVLEAWQYLPALLRTRWIGGNSRVLSLKVLATPKETFVRIVVTPPGGSKPLRRAVEAISKWDIYKESRPAGLRRTARHWLQDWWNGRLRAIGCGSGKENPLRTNLVLCRIGCWRAASRESWRCRASPREQPTTDCLGYFKPWASG